jgi:deoxyuridine 5'-triphosphate nucleotidohydrolase
MLGWYLNEGDGGRPQLPVRHHDGDVGFDLYVSVETIIPPGEFVDVHTHVHARFPLGYWGRITGRSSTLRKHGLLVNEGVIDTGYTGELFAGVWNLTGQPVTLAVGQSVAQLIIYRNHSADVEPVVLVDPPDSSDGRGNNGFGSTGA